MQLYFFTADDLGLIQKMPRKFKLFDAFGNDRFIIVALDDLSIQIFDREDLSVVK